MDLNRILLVFNVRSVGPPRAALTFYSQTELGLNMYVTVSDVRDGVTKTHTVVSEVQHDVVDTRIVVADTHAIVSDIRCKMLGSQEGTEDQNQWVSDTRVTSTTKYMLTVAQNQTRSANFTSMDPVSYVCT